MVKLLYGLLMLFVCTSQGCISDKEPEGPSLKVGDSLPVFSVEMNNGEIITTQSLKGHVSVIVFFNTGCPDCQKELPVIQALWELYKDSELVKIVPIAREESAKEIEAYWKANDLTMPFSPQENRDVYSKFAPSVIPRIYISNTEGVIMASYDDVEMPSLSDLVSVIEAIAK